MTGLTKKAVLQGRPRWLALLVAVLLAVVPAGAAQAEPQIDPPPGARDVSDEWRAFLAADGELDAERVEAAFARVRPELRNYQLVIMPSYLSGLLIDAGELRLTDYFRSQVEALTAEGIDIEIAPVDTEQSVAENGRQLAHYVAASRRPVCVISHSKGGLDTLEFLLHATPDLRRHVACWVVLQSPFDGSPVADLIVNEDWTRGITEPALRALGGDGRSLDDLTVAVRRDYMRQNANAIQAIGESAPIVVLSTYLDGMRTPSLHVAATYHWMADNGIANDGLVPLNAALLPGARFVVIAGLDHTDPIAGKPILGNPVDRVLLLKTLLYLALNDRPT